jgi:hypothetical protein
MLAIPAVVAVPVESSINENLGGIRPRILHRGGECAAGTGGRIGQRSAVCGIEIVFEQKRFLGMRLDRKGEYRPGRQGEGRQVEVS